MSLISKYIFFNELYLYICRGLVGPVVFEYRKKSPSSLPVAWISRYVYLHCVNPIGHGLFCYCMSQEIRTLFAIFVCVLWSGNCWFCPYPSGLLHWHWGNHAIAAMPGKQPWRMVDKLHCSHGIHRPQHGSVNRLLSEYENLVSTLYREVAARQVGSSRQSAQLCGTCS